MVSREDFDGLKAQMEQWVRALDGIQSNIRAEVQAELSAAKAAHDDLYNKANVSIGSMSTNMQQLEARMMTTEAKSSDSAGGGGSRSLLHAKNMLPDKLEKQEGWRQWKSDVEDYCEEKFLGMKDIMDKA